MTSDLLTVVCLRNKTFVESFIKRIPTIQSSIELFPNLHVNKITIENMTESYINRLFTVFTFTVLFIYSSIPMILVASHWLVHAWFVVTINKPRQWSQSSSRSSLLFFSWIIYFVKSFFYNYIHSDSYSFQNIGHPPFCCLFHWINDASPCLPQYIWLILHLLINHVSTWNCIRLFVTGFWLKYSPK